MDLRPDLIRLVIQYVYKALIFLHITVVIVMAIIHRKNSKHHTTYFKKKHKYVRNIN